MLKIEEYESGLIHFERIEPYHGGAVQPDFYVPGAEISQSKNGFGSLLIQHIDRQEYAFWKSTYLTSRDATIRVTDDREFLGFRLMLQKHILHYIVGRHVHLQQGQILFSYMPIIESEWRLRADTVYQVFDMQVRRSVLQEVAGNERAVDFFLNSWDQQRLFLGQVPGWGSYAVLDMVDQLTKHPGERRHAIRLLRAVVTAVQERREDREISERQVESLFRVRGEIRRDLEKDMNLSQWARSANMNITYFKDMFRQVFAITPYRYLLYERVKAAKELLLEEPDLSFTEIAIRTGFTSYKNLWRAFSSQGEDLNTWRNGHGANGI